MYPFERFSEAAKSTLTLAQEESERMHHGYVGTEHLLLAVVQQDATIAGEALARMGVRAVAVRTRIQQVIGSDVRVLTGRIIPTARTKKVIEMSFREARAAGSGVVRTDHILLALMEEGEGVAAHVLAELGVTADEVRTTIEQVHASGIDESASARVLSSERAALPDSLSVAPSAPPFWMREAMTGARAEASAERDTTTGEVHLFQHLLRSPEPRIAAALRRFAVDSAQLRDATRPPERVLELRRALDAAVIDKRAAAAREDYPAAEAALRRENQVREELDAAEAAWRQELSAED